ncbi:OmpA-OmpF porin, OOP family [Andreprevotia lacus DSM 23236]|jgi:OOP family OmpA-OmpF porin|uniref:OmpA-OmpF porin, OOP family n=1 Tax=Andreprevotia lacus DSM 23236 TaxID=1121001 RepID=A0A1W1WXF8_9NEIS|nr:outer membrane beta-barrel protein [Andreprevotia lacus]SMC16108.1 OmpA-OmpF porin, OOP family [Andreprevotia lacus DSM 23236]
MNTLRTLLAISTLGLAAGAYAVDAGKTYLYGDIGQSRYDAGDAVGKLGGAGSNETDFAGSIGAGYRITPNVAVEAGYLNLGRMTAGNSNATAKYSAQGLGLQAVGTVPLNDRFGVYGSAGLNPLYVKSSLAGATDSEWRVVPSVGVGVSYKVSDALGVRGGYTQYFNTVDNQGVKSDTGMLSMGMTYGFN